MLKDSQQLFSSKVQKSDKKLKDLVLIQSCLGSPWQQSSAMNMYKGQLEVSLNAVFCDSAFPTKLQRMLLLLLLLLAQALYIPWWWVAVFLRMTPPASCFLEGSFNSLLQVSFFLWNSYPQTPEYSQMHLNLVRADWLAFFNMYHVLSLTLNFWLILAQHAVTQCVLSQSAGLVSGCRFQNIPRSRGVRRTFVVEKLQPRFWGNNDRGRW